MIMRTWAWDCSKFCFFLNNISCRFYHCFLVYNEHCIHPIQKNTAFYAPTLQICPKCPSIRKCLILWWSGKVGASVSYGHISSLIKKFDFFGMYNHQNVCYIMHMLHTDCIKKSSFVKNSLNTYVIYHR